MKKPVSERALLARINRKLNDGGRKLCRSKPSDKSHETLGRFYLADEHSVLEAHVDLVKLGRELGCLKDSETLLD